MNQPLRIFLDANFLFSAAKSDGPIRALVLRLHDAGHECWVDGSVTDEARRNLSVKAPAHVRSLDLLLSKVHVAAISSATVGASVEGLPETDRPVIAAAAALSCDMLVTGDRTHFGTFYGRLVHGVRIHSPRSLYELVFPNA